jgi:putative hydrolase of the HAD superfamily
MARSLLLDFGGVCLVTPFELHRHTERSYGLAPGSLDWYGPFDPASDPLYVKWQAGEITERRYWAERVEVLGHQLGRPGMTVKEFFDPMFDLPEHEVIRSQLVGLVAECRTRTVPVGILTNDMRDFQTAEWIERISIIHAVDSLVDGSVTGILKPDRRAYQLGVEALGSAAADTVFVDDQRGNVDAAERAGLIGVWFDVTDPNSSVARVRTALGW